MSSAWQATNCVVFQEISCILWNPLSPLVHPQELYTCPDLDLLIFKLCPVKIAIEPAWNLYLSLSLAEISVESWRRLAHVAWREMTNVSNISLIILGRILGQGCNLLWDRWHDFKGFKMKCTWPNPCTLTVFLWVWDSAENPQSGQTTTAKILTEYLQNRRLYRISQTELSGFISDDKPLWHDFHWQK
jgi:hypothetical protein